MSCLKCKDSRQLELVWEPQDKYVSLLKDSKFLHALLDAGVEHWYEYDKVIEQLEINEVWAPDETTD